MKKQILTLILFLTTFSIYAQDSGDKITGVWLNEEFTAKMEITKQGDFYSGKIIWLSEPNDKNGNPLVDKKNPDKKKRNQPILGSTILSELEYSDGEWTGNIYAPKAGKSTDCIVKLDGMDVMQIKVTQGFFSRTKVWTRVK